MEISQHIKNLLMTNNRVILSGFGAFDSKYIPAKIDKETKTMTPPQKIIVFNPEFTQDEGFLAKEMSEKEGISLENAKEQINEYVKTIKTKLESGDKVVFKDLGEFVKKDNKYEFSYLSGDNLLVDSFGLPKVSLSGQDNKTVIPPKKDVRKEPIKPIKKEKAKPVSKPKPKTKKEIKPKPVKKTKQAKLKTEHKKKKRFWPVLLIILGVIGILLVAVYFFKPDLWKKGYAYSSDKIATVKSSIFGDRKDDLEIITPEDIDVQTEKVSDTVDSGNQTDIVAEDTTNVDELAENTDETVNEENSNIEEDNSQSEDAVENNTEVVEDNTNDVSVNTNTSSATSGKYYIIIGSVKTKAAADREQKRYAAKGISTTAIYADKLDRYRISIGEFSSAKAAQDFFKEFENKHGNIEAWVWEKR